MHLSLHRGIAGQRRPCGGLVARRRASSCAGCCGTRRTKASSSDVAKSRGCRSSGRSIQRVARRDCGARSRGQSSSASPMGCQHSDLPAWQHWRGTSGPPAMRCRICLRSTGAWSVGVMMRWISVLRLRCWHGFWRSNEPCTLCRCYPRGQGFGSSTPSGARWRPSSTARPVHCFRRPHQPTRRARSAPAWPRRPWAAAAAVEEVVEAAAMAMGRWSGSPRTPLLSRRASLGWRPWPRIWRRPCGSGRGAVSRCMSCCRCAGPGRRQRCGCSSTRCSRTGA
mmetsp:Transcript_89988/g.234525  ORF Transcript_89988/g.234525 Transcript_89988/m.234525 type:complete len:281 (+) Transcript_89988:270-1112(+)